MVLALGLTLSLPLHCHLVVSFYSLTSFHSHTNSFTDSHKHTHTHTTHLPPSLSLDVPGALLFAQNGAIQVATINEDVITNFQTQFMSSISTLSSSLNSTVTGKKKSVIHILC